MGDFRNTRLYEFIEERYYDIRSRFGKERYQYDDDDDDDDDDYYDDYDDQPWYRQKKTYVILASTVVLATSVLFFVKANASKNTNTQANQTLQPLTTELTGKTLDDTKTDITKADFHNAIQTGDGRSKYNKFLAENPSIKISAKRQLPEIEADVAIVQLSDGFVLVLFKNDVIIQLQDFDSEVTAKDYITSLLNANVTKNEDGSSTTSNGVTLPSEESLEKLENESESSNESSFEKDFEDSEEASDTSIEGDSSYSNGNKKKKDDDDEDDEDEDEDNDDDKDIKDQLKEEKEAREKAEEKAEKAEEARQKAETEAKNVKTEADKAELKRLKEEANKAQAQAEKAKAQADKAEKALTVANFKDRIHVGTSVTQYQHIINKNAWTKTSTISLYDGAYMNVFKTISGAYIAVGINSSVTKITTVRQASTLSDIKALAKKIKYQSAYTANKEKSAKAGKVDHSDAPDADDIQKQIKDGQKTSTINKKIQSLKTEIVATFDTGKHGDMLVITAKSGFIVVSVKNGKANNVEHMKTLKEALKEANSKYAD